MSKRIEVDDDVYAHIAGHTQHIGESASDILRRLLDLPPDTAQPVVTATTSQRRIFDVLNHADLAGQRSVVARFLHILAMLYRCHADDFNRVLQVRGRDRMYFAASEIELEQAGNSTNPKQIPASPYWVITNNNTTRKKSMLTQVAKELGYSEADAEKIRDFL